MTEIDTSQTNDTSIFASYLEQVPEDARESVTGYLKDAEKNVNSRLQEAAQLQKQFGAYQGLDLSQYSPDELSDLLAWHQQVTQNEDSFKEWLQNTYNEAGLGEKKEIEENLPDELTRDDIKSLIDTYGREALGPIEQRFEEWEQEQAVNSIENSMLDSFSQIEKESDIQLSPEEKLMVVDLGLNYDGEDWINYGFKRFEEITAAGTRHFVEQKSTQPGTPMTTGGQAAFKPTTDWAEAKAQALERIRQH